MKSVAVLSLLLPLVLATNLYNIWTKSKSPEANNLYLSIDHDHDKVYALPDTRKSGDQFGFNEVFFTTLYYETQTLSVQAGSDHQLCLRIQKGNKGLMTLIDLKWPNDVVITKEEPTEWSVFKIGKGQELLVEDGQHIPSRQWVMYSELNKNYIGLWDGITPQSRSFENVTLILKDAYPTL